MDERVERWFPLLMGFITTTIYLYFLRNYSLPSSVKDLFSSTMQISSILIGFLITTLSILLSIEDKKIIQHLERLGSYNKLINYFIDATKWSFCLVTASSVGLLINFNIQQSWHYLAFATWLFVLTTTVSSCYRAFDIFASIIRS